MTKRPNFKLIGPRFKAMRKARAISRARLAAKLGLDPKTIERLEKGIAIRVENLLSLCDEIGYSEGELTGYPPRVESRAGGEHRMVAGRDAPASGYWFCPECRVWVRPQWPCYNCGMEKPDPAEMEREALANSDPRRGLRPDGTLGEETRGAKPGGSERPRQEDARATISEDEP